MDTLEKELPNAPDAERVILGTLLISPSLAPDTLSQLRADEFYSAMNRAIFSAMREMLDAGEEIDLVLLVEHLRGKDTMPVSYSSLANLTKGIPPNLRLASCVQQVKEKANLRRLLKKGNELIARIMDGGETSEVVAQWASMSFDELAQNSTQLTTPFILSYAEFMAQQFTDGEVIALHSRKGEIVIVQSVTDRGKSTFIRNMGLTVSTGGEFLPFVDRSEPRKVLLLNFEGSGDLFQKDLAKMARDFTHSELDLIKENFFPVHAPFVYGEPFTLSRHMSFLQAQARRIKPDIILIDTASAAFEIRNENDNAEIQFIMKSLTHLARRLNCLVVLIHHIGKAKLEAGQTREAAHRGRGASAWADFSTTIFNLEADPKNKDLVILECAKRKDGEKYKVTLKLNREARWFAVVDNALELSRSGYNLILETVKGFDQVVTRKEINKTLKGKASVGTVTRCLKEAVDRGDIIKTGRGLYQFNKQEMLI